MINSDDLIAGKRRALAKAITLVESAHPDHKVEAQRLLQQILQYSGNSIRIGISGSPGVGKSSFIEAFGLYLLSQGKKLAVLAVDPSSPNAGGSILGDKTRMESLSREANAFIRPSPSSGELGGVAQKTRESMLLCEAAGFDIVIVETVGVGQSEFEVARMVDFFLVLMQPYGGDDLQGMKKGIMEMADALVINKADGESKVFAQKARRDYQNALHLVASSSHWHPRVMTCSAKEKTNIDSVWHMIVEFSDTVVKQGLFQQKRSEQNRAWMQRLFQELLEVKLKSNHGFITRRTALEKAVECGEITPISGAQNLLDLLGLKS